VLTVCPRCQTPAAPGAGFCGHCGSPLAAFRPGPIPTGEVWVGEIPNAFCVVRRWGPVRVVLTDRRVLVLWTGPYQFLPSPTMYKTWKSSLPLGPRTRLVGTPWFDPGSEVLWDVDYAAVHAARARRPIGIGIDRDVCDVYLTVWGDGVRMTTDGAPPENYLARGEFTPMVVLRVPGDPETIEQFFQKTPLAPVAGARL